MRVCVGSHGGPCGLQEREGRQVVPSADSRRSLPSPFIFAGALKYAALKTFLTPYAEAKGAKTAKASAKVKEEL